MRSIVHDQSAVGRHRFEHSDVVVSKIPVVVFLLRERDAGLPEHVAEGQIMQRLAVRDDAVEVEHNRPQHVEVLTLAF